MWHRVAPALAEHFTVVCPDLRGYGDSDKPAGGENHVAYAKRTLAEEQLALTARVYASLNRERATTVWRYLFLIQPPDLPERLIGRDPAFYLRWTLEEWCGTPEALTPEAVAEYRRWFDDATIHATCEDYRAGATVDLSHDAADAAARLSCPLLVLWSAAGIGAAHDVRAIWGERADRMQGRPLDCGHFIAEGRPEATAAELLAFL